MEYRLKGSMGAGRRPAGRDVPAARSRNLDRLARNLGPTPERMVDVWKQAALAQIDREVRAGQATPEQMLADWLGQGTTPEDTAQARRRGQSLADFARAKGKSEAGLIQFLRETAYAQIERAVGDGQLSADQAGALKAQITPARLAQLVEAKQVAIGD